MIRHRSRLPRQVAALTGVLTLIAISTTGSASTSAPASAADSSSVTRTRTVTRSFIGQDGTSTTVNSNKVTLTVGQTQNLHSLQLIHVSWSGAKPTGALVADQNSDLAQNEEYPFALFECRGTDSASNPITPDTCWTQYADERLAVGYDDPPYPAWRADSAATSTQRKALVNPPKSLTPQCATGFDSSTTQRWVPFVAADRTVYPGGLGDCAVVPPEATAVNGGSVLSLPSNETYGVTDAAGRGSTDFDVFTTEDHASLGCSQTVACTLVAVPVEGLSCDPYGTLLPADQQPDADAADAAAQTCEAGPRYKPGAILRPSQSGAAAVSGKLWWSPSNWANRISVPLGFAPPDNACALDSSGDPVDIYGSELMIQATTQWAPHFCLDKDLFNLKHVQTPEPQARNLLAISNIEAAYTSEPPDPGSPYPTPTVNAPVAVTGFGIGYSIDDANGKAVTNLRLDARLLAKLLTESYPAENFIREGDPGLQNNPFTIADDPEFQALNPGLPTSVSAAASTLLTVNSDSDVTYALTSYINADPEARAWLDGKPDPWGMAVNPAYKKIALPVDNFPLLDTYEPLDEYRDQIPCLAAAPVPYLPLVAAPTARLFSIAQDVEFSLAQTQTVCTQPLASEGDPTAGAKMTAAGRQGSGHHFMLGVVSLGDAARNGVSVASLQTHDDRASTGTFTDAGGRSFAAPDTAGLRAAAATLTADPKSGVFPLRYASLQSEAADAGAYPGTMVVYAAIPTKGLPAGDGAKYATVLRFDAGPGQTPGVAQGTLPQGYLPMTSANGLGGLAAYTLRAAKAVAAQQGYLPSLTKADPPPTPPATRTTPPAGGATPTTGTGGSGGSNAGAGTVVGGTPTAPSTPGGRITTAPSGRPTSAASAGSTPPLVTTAKTLRQGAGAGGLVLPVLLLLAIAALGISLAVRIGAKPR